MGAMALASGSVLFLAFSCLAPAQSPTPRLLVIFDPTIHDSATNGAVLEGVFAEIRDQVLAQRTPVDLEVRTLGFFPEALLKRQLKRDRTPGGRKRDADALARIADSVVQRTHAAWTQAHRGKIPRTRTSCLLTTLAGLKSDRRDAPTHMVLVSDLVESCAESITGDTVDFVRGISKGVKTAVATLQVRGFKSIRILRVEHREITGFRPNQELEDFWLETVKAAAGRDSDVTLRRVATRPPG